MRSNPFQPLTDRTNLPKKVYSDFSANDGLYIVEYAPVKRIKKLGEKDTDFVLEDDVEEVSRISRAEYINSFRNDVGILNIIQKVRLSGDISLLNQTGRVMLPSSGEVDSLGRDLEPVVDVTKYQVDPIDGIEVIKNTKINYKDGLPVDLVDGLGFEAVANLTDEQIDAYLAKQKENILAAQAAAKGDN